MTAEEILTLVRSVAGKRRRADAFEVLNAVLRQQSHLSAGDGRRELVAGLRELESRQAIKLPAQRSGWDHLGQTAMPKWIQLIPVLPAKNDWDHRTHPWHQRLAFLGQLSRVANSGELIKLNEWLLRMPDDEPLVPIKERSWEILGDEKRLEAMLGTALFQPDRLSLGLLRCYVVPHIPVHRVYPQARPALIVSENEAGFDSFCRIAAQFGEFRCVIFGNGLAVEKSRAFLGQAIKDYAIEECYYFGDLDAAGLSIAARAAANLKQDFGRELQPWLAGYEAMLEQHAGASALPADSHWLPPALASRATDFLKSEKRGAQESHGWKALHRLLSTKHK